MMMKMKTKLIREMGGTEDLVLLRWVLLKKLKLLLTNLIPRCGHCKNLAPEVGVFLELSGDEYTNFKALAEKMRSDYEFGYTTDAKLLPRSDSSVKKLTLRLFKPFDELVVDSQDFSLEAAEKFIAECIPTVTIFSKDPAHHPNVIKFVISPNAKALLAEIYDAQAILTGKALDLTQIHNGDCKDLGCVVEVQIVHCTQKMC